MSNTGGIQLSDAQIALASTINPVQADSNRTLFGKLLPAYWRLIPFPYSGFHVSLRQDLVQHKFADLDAADVEATGRAPIEFKARIPFLNNIQAGPSETWKAGALFPDAFQKFFAAFADRTSAYLQHPSIGQVYCKPDKLDFEIDAKTRDGVYVDASWIETFEPQGSVNPSISAGGQLPSATQSGIDLDNLLPTLPPSAFPQLPTNVPSFGDFARSLQSVSDQVSLLEYTSAGKVDSIIGSVQAVQFSISQATGNQADSAVSVQAWPVRDAIDRYTQALIGIRNTLLSSGQKTNIYLPPSDTSLPLLCQTIPAPIGDLMSLNPALIASIVVPADTIVLYYAP